MNLLVVGATGRTGRLVVDEAVARGHTVRALSRGAGQGSWPAGVEPLAADVLADGVAAAAVRGVDAIVVALSMVRASDSPWAPILTPRDLHTRAATALTQAAHHAGVRRYVTVSAQGVGPSWVRAGWAFLTLVHASNIGVAYRELARAERVVLAAGLDATVVRPTRLTTVPGGPIRVGTGLVTWSGSSIPRGAVARFLVEAAEGSTFVGEAVTITRA
jgi:uncharacterized protein YbjT (DUF2867 family)